MFVNSLRQPKLKSSPGLEAVKLRENGNVEDAKVSSNFNVGSLVNLKNNEQVPLKQIEFNVQIRNSVAEVNISQIYHNASDAIIETEFLFAISSKAVFHSLSVLFEDKIIQGVIKEKQQAKAEYQQGVAQGKTMAYSEVIKNLPDVMKLNIGNILPQQTITVILSYVEQLEVCMNKFWRLSLVTTTTPRYTPKFERYNEDVQKVGISIGPEHTQAYPFKINISIHSNDQLTFVKSPTHPVVVQAVVNENSTGLTNITLNSLQFPHNDFILLFANKSINQPQIEIGNFDYPVPYCAQVTFVPDFNTASLDDAYSAYMDENNLVRDDFDIDAKFQRGEYVFFIDRSGSMEGLRIKKAREALVLFLKSLPVDSYFQIISFGSHFAKMFDQSQKYGDTSLQQALEKVRTFDADMGGTEIQEALLECYSNSSNLEGYPRNLFLLTDGSVSNSDQVIGLIKLYSTPTCRLYTMGIGSGCSRYLIDMGAEFGGGLAEYVSDNEDLNDKVMTLLQDSITPFLNDVSVSFTNPEAIEMIVPDPVSLNGIRKNKPFTFYVFLNEKFKDYKNELSNIAINYEVSDGALLCNKLDLLPSKIQKTNIFHKIGSAQIIKEITNAAKFKYDGIRVLSKVDALSEQSIVEYSIKYGVLSEFTSFLCQVSDNQDDIKRQIIEHSEKHQIIVPVISKQLQPPPQSMYPQFGMYPQYAMQAPMQTSGGMFRQLVQMQSGPPSPPQQFHSFAKFFSNGPPSLQCGVPPPPVAFGMPIRPPPPPAMFCGPPPPPPPGAPYNGMSFTSMNFSSPPPPSPPSQFDQYNDIIENCCVLQRSEENQMMMEDLVYCCGEKEEDEDEQIELFKPQQEEKKESIQMEQLLNIQKDQTQDKTQSKKIDFLQVLNVQNAVGKFALNQNLLQQLGVDYSLFIKGIPLTLHNQPEMQDIWMTIFILEWLEYHWKEKQNSWKLVGKKAQDYLKQLGVNQKQFKDEIQQFI